MFLLDIITVNEMRTATWGFRYKRGSLRFFAIASLKEEKVGRRERSLKEGTSGSNDLVFGWIM